MNRLSLDRQLDVFRHLCDGCGIRQTERLCEVHQNTIMRYLVRWGQKAAGIQDRAMRDLSPKHIAFDEQHTFVKVKSRNLPDERKADSAIGDQWIFMCQDVESRAIISHHVGKRVESNVRRIVSDTANRIKQPSPHESDDHRFAHGAYKPVVQISTDALSAYREAIDSSFGRHCVQYGQIVKDTGPLDRPGKQWAERRVIFGQLDKRTINTAYLERLNLTNRHFMRRLVRRCLCFSKKLENLIAAVALYVLFYNFSWQPRKFRYRTPGQRIGVASKRLRVRDLFERLNAE